ncbi:hypothetical protein [Agrobacterium larrymoorei]|uniref:Uncharacterized protein n=1 Tax=Agrobacterium larrymoorei TaxID=160699 RepID=A0AAF0HG05_9HYPH|nr:hypothetical protein [Agrobacterium larrymoorei]WHA44058.1 hypothetical protein CFBP5477_021825 [Agrobacterium larrymoorei]
MSIIIQISSKFEIKTDFIPFYVTDKSLDGCYHYVASYLGIKSNGSLTLGQSDMNETYCFHREGSLWVFYYSEKGMRTGGVFFVDLSDAIDFISGKIKSGELK